MGVRLRPSERRRGRGRAGRPGHRSRRPGAGHTGVRSRRGTLGRALCLAGGGPAPVRHPLLRSRRFCPARPYRRHRSRARPRRGQPALPARAAAARGARRPAPAARRRDAVPVAGRHLVDGAGASPALAGGLPAAGRGPRRQGLHRGAPGRRPLPGHAAVRPARRQRGRLPWDGEFTRLDPAWFDAADRRIEHVVEQGMVPAIVGSWGYFMQFAGAGCCAGTGAP